MIIRAGSWPDRTLTGSGWSAAARVITGFDQYAHLSEVDALVRANPGLRITVGMD